MECYKGYAPFLFDAFQVTKEASIWPSGNRLKSRHLNMCFGVTLDSSSPQGDQAAVPSGRTPPPHSAPPTVN